MLGLRMVCKELKLFVDLPVRVIVRNKELGLFKVTKGSKRREGWVIPNIGGTVGLWAGQHHMLRWVRVDNLRGEFGVRMVDNQCFSRGQW